MRKWFCGLLAALLLTTGSLSACASVRPEGSFRLGGGGKDYAQTAPIPLPDGGLIVAISSQGGISGEPLYPKGVRKTLLMRLSADGNERWHTVWDGAARLNGMDSDGNVLALCRFKGGDGETYAQQNAFRTDTGELLTRGTPMKLVYTSYDDDPHITSRELPNFVFVTEIHDPEASTEPRSISLNAADGTELWRLNQKEIALQNVSQVVQLEDGILLLGTSGELPDGTSSMAYAAKLSRSGELVWRYIQPEMAHGDFDQAFMTADGQATLFGWGHARTPDGQLVGVCIATRLTLDSGATVWSKLQTDRNSAFRTRGSITPVSDGYAVARYDSDAQVFCVALMDDSGELTGSWSVPAPGITSYYSETVFDWNGELWLQAVADNGSRWDAHYQKLGAEFAVEQGN